MKKILFFIYFYFLNIFLAATQDSPIYIGSRLELFIDSFIIDQLNNTILVLHEPKDEGIVLTFNMPWEGHFSGYTTIIKDSNLFRLYYRGSNEKEVTCYAESLNGIDWDKPNLKICLYDSSFNNNIILNEAPFCHNFCPFIDNNPKAPKSEKYKAIAGKKSSGLFGFKSSDGIHWEKITDKPLITQGSFDSQNVAFWSQTEKTYICYFRTWIKDTIPIRTISRSTSIDFINWSNPVKMSFGETPYENLYTNQTHPYYRAPHIYIAIAARFVPDLQVVSDQQALKLKVHKNYYHDCSDIIFMSSRGGINYNRTFMEAFLKPGIGFQNWVSRTNYPALNVVQTDSTEMTIYVNQNYSQPQACLRRYALRIDGFSSLKASYKEGDATTKSMIFKGRNLFINFATSAVGKVQIEIQNQHGVTISGFSLSDSEILVGNEIKRLVSWKNNPDLSSLSGKAIKLKFLLKDANLYSFKFE